MPLPQQPPHHDTPLQQQQTPEDIFTSSPEDPWHLTFNELKVMRARMGTLEKVEAATLDFAQQLQAFTNKTTALEKNTSQNALKIKQLEQEILKLQETVGKQQNTIQNVYKIKEKFSKNSQKIVSEMNGRLEQQRQQVESFRAVRKDVQADTRSQKAQLEAFKNYCQEVQEDTQNQKQQLEAFKISCQEGQDHIQQQIRQAAEDAEHDKMLDYAFQNCHNIIIGLPEQNGNSTYSVVAKFFKNKLNMKKPSIASAYRIGRSYQDGNPYIRPILVKFYTLADRNSIWKRRGDIPQGDDQQKIKIQADLPKKLRDRLGTLYKVVKAAAGMEEFKSAVIRNYAITLHGKRYTPDQLELLPPPIRPSSLSVRESDDALVFYSKHCFLSITRRQFSNWKIILSTPWSTSYPSRERNFHNRIILFKEPPKPRTPWKQNPF